MTPAVYTDLDTLLSDAPRDLGATGWAEITPGEIAGFEAATSGAVSPYFALSLTNRFLPDLIQVTGAASGVNYGADSIRFGDPLFAGERVRCTASLVQASEVSGGVQTTVEVRVEVEGRQEPACVVESLSRWLR